MKKVLVSYATPNYYLSQQYLVASSKQFFNAHASYTPELIDEGFIEKNKHIFNLSRGGGYWLWKPYIIQKVLSMLSEGDFLFYIDSGNLITGNINPLFDICARDSRGILFFDNRDGCPEGGIWKNDMWTKFDCFEVMKCNTDEYVNGNQIDGSYVLVQKNKFSVEFFNEYLTWCETGTIITDEPSVLGEDYPAFRQHRHDQSILSLMAIKYKLPVSREPSEWGNHLINDKSEYGQLFMHHRGVLARCGDVLDKYKVQFE